MTNNNNAAFSVSENNTGTQTYIVFEKKVDGNTINDNRLKKLSLFVSEQK
jgi:hypothetical protein